MGGWRSRLILMAMLGSVAAAPVAAGEIQGILRCGDRCADFVAYIEDVRGSWDASDLVVEFGQRDKVFIPHVLALLKGSTLRIGNDDPFLHNVHARKDGETVFNVNLLFQYQTMDMVIEEAGLYQISCEPHPEMSAVLVALDNPFFARPDAEGRFRIEGVPRGTYQVVSLDAEKGRRKRKPVTVGEGVATVDFTPLF